MASSLLLPQPRRKRSFTLPSFRKTAPDQPPLNDTSVAARNRKAAAWQWYTRGLGEVVLPTKRPIPAPPGVAAQLRADDHPKPPELVETSLPFSPNRTPSSRFKAEASASSRPPGVTLPAIRPSTAILPTGTPLYDDFELSSLKSQMADLVQRLQQKPDNSQHITKLQHRNAASNAQAPADGASGDTRSGPPAADGITQSVSLPSATGPASVDSAIGGTPSLIPARLSPMASFRRFLRKLISFPTFAFHASAAALPEPQISELSEESEAEDMQFHYHHYIHHYHHHYHYDPSPKAMVLPRLRRHSESSGLCPRLSRSPWPELKEGYGDEEEEGSPISAFLSRRRRFSDSAFGEKHNSWVDPNVLDKVGAEKAAMEVTDLQLLRRHNSDRFAASLNSTLDDLLRDGAHCEKEQRPVRSQIAVARSRRRHSTESFREGDKENMSCRSYRKAVVKDASVSRKAEGGGPCGSGTYKLGGAAAAAEGGRMDAIRRRRHSESALRVPSRQAQVLVSARGQVAP